MINKQRSFVYMLLLTGAALVYVGMLPSVPLYRQQLHLTAPRFLVKSRISCNHNDSMNKINNKTRSCGINIQSDDIPIPYELDINGSDVLVFMHIPKASGGNVMRRLVRMQVQPPCEFNDPVIKTDIDKFTCSCVNANNATWLFGDCNGGRWACGEHADISTLQTCVPSFLDQTEAPRMRRYFYTTFIRDPVLRYISEWMHTAAGSRWNSVYLTCNGPFHKSAAIKPCFHDDDRDEVTLRRFMTCPYNYAANRQTWMLADINTIGCQRMRNMSAADVRVLVLDSAKQTLRNLPFFGITEHLEQSQFLFERTFSIKWHKQVHVHESLASESLSRLSAEEFNEIKRLNDMDVELYKYAYTLFLDRLNNIEHITD